MIYSVYKVTFENSKCYIGITSRDLKSRKLEHKSTSKRGGSYFHNALNKYNTPNWEIIFQSKSVDSIKWAETEFIKIYKSNDSNYGYNLTVGGDGISGYIFSKKQNTHNSIRRKIYLSKKENKEKLVNRLKKYYNENPDARSNNMKKYLKQNPEKSKIYLKNLTGTGKSKRKICLLDIDSNNVLNFNSLKEAHNYTKLSMGSLSNLINGLRTKVKNYRLEKTGE